MRKILGLVVVIVAVYSGYWFYEAKKGKEYIEHKMSEANIHADKISLSGYPFTYNVAIENPIWVQDNTSVSLQGTIHLVTNIIGNKFWISRDGELHAKLEGFNELESVTIKGDNQLFFELRDSFYPNHPFQSLPMSFSDEEHLVLYHKIKEVVVTGKNFQLEIANGQDSSQVNIGRIDLKWNNAFTENTQTHKFDLYLKDYDVKTVTPQNFGDIIHNMTPLSQLELAGEFTIPREDFNFFMFPEMSWNISKLDSSSELGDGKSNASFSIVKKDGHRVNIHFDLDSTNSIFEKPFKESVDKMIAQLKDPKTSKNIPEAEKIRELLKTNENEVRDVIPNLAKLSPFGMKININAFLDTKNPASQNGEINVDNFNVLMTPYSFLSDGNFKLEANQTDGSYKIKLVNYKALVDDIVAYGNNLFNFLNKIYGKEAQIGDYQITPKMHEDVLHFLRDISDDPKSDSKDLHITLKVHKDGSATIGTLDMEQAMAKWEGIFAEPKKQ